MPPIEDPVFGKIERRRFSNGMEFYGIQRKDVPLVSYGVLIKTGAANETRKNNGVSHFLEHLIFKGTPNLKPGESDRLLEDLGAGVNAWTGFDGTFYYIYNTPKEGLNEAIRIEAEKVQNMLLPPEELLKERFTVVEEIKRSKNSKNSQMFNRLFESVFANHPYRRPILGPSKNIGDDLRVILDPASGPKASANFALESASKEHQTWRKVLEALAVSSERLPTHSVSGEPFTEDETKKAKKLKALLKQRGLTPRDLLSAPPFNPLGTPLTETELRTRFKVRDLSREEILAYYAKHYAPQNRAVIVVGDFDMNEVLHTVAEEYNKPFPPKDHGRTYPANLASQRPRAYTKPLSTQGIQPNRLVRDQVKMATLAQGFQVPGAGGASSRKTLLALDLLANILGGDESSRLYQSLVEKQQIANAINLGLYEMKERSLFYLVSSCQPEHLETIKAQIRDAFAQIADHGVSDKELKKAKMMLKSDFADHSETQDEVIYTLASTIRGGSLKSSLGNSLKYLDSITSQDIQAVARKYLTDGASRTVSLVPADYGLNAKKLKKNATPKPEAPKFSGKLRFSGQLRASDQSFILPGGAELIVQERPTSLKTAITLGIKGGNRADSKLGETDLLAKMIERGTPDFPAEAVQDALAAEGLDMDIVTTPDLTKIHIEGLSEKAPQQVMFRVLRKLLSGPAFTQADLDFVRKQEAQDYQSDVDKKPQRVVADLLHEAIYPKEHPYGATTGRAIALQDQITTDDLRRAFQQLFRKGNITIGVVGKVKADQVKSQMAKILAPLQDEPPMIPAVQPATISASKVVTKSREDIKQAEIMRAWIAPSKAHEDRVPMAMLNGILNAGMSSRLFQTFREGEKGLCYQVYTKHEANEEGGTFKFYIGTDPDNITLVRQLFQAEVDKLMTTLPSAEEMKRVRLLMKSNILADTQKSADVSNHLVAHRSGKHLSNLELAAALESVTPQQVQEVARKYLSKPSISAILAPKSALSAHGLPVDGEVEGA